MLSALDSSSKRTRHFVNLDAHPSIYPQQSSSREATLQNRTSQPIADTNVCTEDVKRAHFRFSFDSFIASLNIYERYINLVRVAGRNLVDVLPVPASLFPRFPCGEFSNRTGMARVIGCDIWKLAIRPAKQYAIWVFLFFFFFSFLDGSRARRV